ncbi:Protein kinase domain-containing protein [Aphelenchoides besseyi]|nr:Protein kinase domain-containing protein [Aphelenchoides besseyi]KAI6201081.1 Protein kinase domain-containing protein [Aphelenchoides besseyi]
MYQQSPTTSMKRVRMNRLRYSFEHQHPLDSPPRVSWRHSVSQDSPSPRPYRSRLQHSIMAAASSSPSSSALNVPTNQRQTPSPQRQHASFSAPTRRESMTRLFLRSDAVFQAYEEEQQRKAKRVPRYASVDMSDEPLAQLFNDAQTDPRRFEQTSLKNSFDTPVGTQATNQTTSNLPTARIYRSTSIQSTNPTATEVPRRCSAFAMDAQQVKKQDVDSEYTVVKSLGTGRFGYVKLVEHRASGQTVALKFFPRPQVKLTDFIREYNFSKLLSPHPNVIETFDGIYQSTDETAFYFVQEFCPHASLRELVENSSGGIGELATKRILLSVLSAVDFMHSENLVHRNLKAENVKISDFGLTQKVNATVKNLEYTNAYHSPEQCDTVVNEKNVVAKPTDIWAIGILFYYCLKGRHPWQKASIVCRQYFEWTEWMKHKLPQLPKRYDVFTEKAIKLQKRCLIARPKERWTCKDIKRCIEKERLLKQVKSPVKSATIDECEMPETDRRHKSTIHHWLTNTLTVMNEISEQVVSARNQ